LHISNLGIRFFRNIQNLNIEPKNGLNLFLGKNGQGKTSLLEAVYYLSFSKSFRTSDYHDVIHFGEEKGLIQSRFHDQVEHSVRVIFDQDRKRIFLNEKPTTPKSIFEKIKVIAFTPESLSAVKLGPELRRELFDEAALLFLSEAYDVQHRFTKALRQKNALLKQIRTEQIDQRKGMDLLDTLNTLFIEASADLVFIREKIKGQLTQPAQEALEHILGEKVDLLIETLSSESPWKERAIAEVQERLEKEILDPKNMKIEMALGRSNAGPQKHDYKFLFNGNDARFFCSQGQQRAVILSFKIAQIVYHKQALNSLPLLLLDDVLSEFDEQKQNYLINFLEANEAQTFLTSTEYGKTLKKAKVFYIENGSIKETAG
jgi:DNA replication and repair protein RecF